MAAWVDLDPLNLLAGKPLVQTETLAFRENPIALAEQATGAPKIADNIVTGTVTTTIADVDDYGGVWIDAMTLSSTGTHTVRVSFSDDGSTFYGLTTIASFAVNITGSTRAYFNFSDGAYVVVSDSSSSGTGTVAGLSDAVVSVRIQTNQVPQTMAFAARLMGGNAI